MQNFLFHLQQCTRCCIEFDKKHSSFIESQLFFKMSQISQRLVFMKKKLNWTRQLTAQWNTEQLIEVSGSFQDRRLNDLKWNGFLGLMAPPLVLVRPQKFKYCLHLCRLYCECLKFETAENYPLCTQSYISQVLTSLV